MRSFDRAGLDTGRVPREACNDGFSNDVTKGYAHCLGPSKLLNAWTAAQLQSNAKQYVDVVHEAHGEPVQMLTADWLELMDQLRSKYGKHLHECKRRSQSYYAGFRRKARG